MVTVSLAAQNLIAIDVTTDQYGSETMWQFDGINVNFNQFGAWYEDQDEPGSYPQPTQFLDLPNGMFNFCLGDIFDDGFCCEYGQGSFTITHVASGTVLFHTDTFSTGIVCTQFGVPLGRVQGKSFLDDDHDCIAGPSEPVLPGQIVRILPGPFFAFTDGLGTFDLNLPNGSYTAEVITAGLHPICPPTRPVPFTITDSAPFPEVMIGDSSISKLDIVSVASIGLIRAGANTRHYVQVSNASAFVSGPITVTAQLDPLFEFESATITPSSAVGGTVTWQLPALAPFTQHQFRLDAYLPPDPGLIGQPVAFTVQASQTLDELVLWNNTFTLNSTVIGSYDPNDKMVWPREVYDLAIDSVLDYTIRFQNTGNDTAFTVVITDTLAATLDMGSFQPGAASHPCTITFKPGRVVEWRFQNILLPDSTVNEPESHGHVSFRIRPAQPLLPGTSIRNNADIFFDINLPIRTNDAEVIAEFTTGGQSWSEDHNKLRLFPNPTSDVLTVVIPAGMDFDFELLTLDGRKLNVATILRSDGPQLDVRTLSPGIYILRHGSGSASFLKF